MPLWYSVWWGSFSSVRECQCQLNALVPAWDRAPSTMVVHGSLQVLQHPQLWQGSAFAWLRRAQWCRVAEEFCSFVIHNWRLPHWLSTATFSVLKTEVGGCVHVWLMTSFVIHDYQYLWSWDLQCSKMNLWVLEILYCVLLWILHSS